MRYNDIVLHVCKYTDGLHRKCGNNCLFCSENTDKNKTKGILPTIEMISGALENICLNRGAKEKIENIHIAGGEPTLREDIYDIVKIVANYGSKIYISTHGNYNDSKTICKKLKASGVTNAAFSLHGHNATIHDATTRTTGSFENTINSISNFIEEGLVTHVNCVVTSMNVKNLDKIVKLAAEKFNGIAHLTFSHYRQHGEACEHHALNFDPWEHKLYISKAIDASLEKNVKINFRDFPLCIEPRIEFFNTDVEDFYVIIWKDSGEDGLFSEEAAKSLLPMCEECDKNKCSGYITANIERYDKYSAWGKKI